MELYRATAADAPLLAEHRRAVWSEVGAATYEALAPQVAIWTDFIRDALAAETLVAFVAREDGRTIGSGGVLTQLTFPRAGLAHGRGGRVQSLYVVPGARRRGVARAIVSRLIAYARAASFVSLTLRPSDEGRPLYEALGFRPVPEMRLLLAED